MSNLLAIKEEIALTEQIKNMSQTYQEIASMRMAKIREDVILTRDFLKRLHEVYFEVKLNYKREIEKISSNSFFYRILKGKKSLNDLKSFATFSQNGKTLSVLISSNDRLIGQITKKVVSEFTQNIKQQNTDVLIIGKMGKKIFDSNSEIKKFKYSYYDYPQDGNLEFYKTLISIFVKYQKVNVFYGKFLNLVNQIAEKTDITAEEIPDKDVYQKRVPYLFEPSLKEVLKFFEIQICFSLLKQSFNESKLAHFGSQMHSMEQTSQNSQKILEKLMVSKTRLEKQKNNKKALMQISGISLWGT